MHHWHSSVLLSHGRSSQDMMSLEAREGALRFNTLQAKGWKARWEGVADGRRKVHRAEGRGLTGIHCWAAPCPTNPRWTPPGSAELPKQQRREGGREGGREGTALSAAAMGRGDQARSNAHHRAKQEHFLGAIAHGVLLC